MLQHSAKKLVFFFFISSYNCFYNLLAFLSPKADSAMFFSFLSFLNQIKTSSSLTDVGALRMFQQI